MKSKTPEVWDEAKKRFWGIWLKRTPCLGLAKSCLEKCPCLSFARRWDGTILEWCVLENHTIISNRTSNSWHLKVMRRLLNNFSKTFQFIFFVFLQHFLFSDSHKYTEAFKINLHGSPDFSGFLTIGMSSISGLWFRAWEDPCQVCFEPLATLQQCIPREKLQG